MKKIILYIICIGFVLPLVSCKDILDTVPTDKPSETTFWKTKADFDKALTGCYTALQTKRLAAYLMSYDCMTDNTYRAAGGSGDFANESYVTGLLNPSSTGHVTDIYSQAYDAIARINIFLSQLKTVVNSNITEAQRKNMIAEAHFLRGYCYWMLYMFYGEVPVVTEPLTIDNQIMPKKTRAEVYAHVLSDLQTSIDNFSAEQTYKVSGGKATKGAARGLKARVLMFNAFNASGQATQSEVQKAYDELALITGYSLNPEYAYNYYNTNQEASPEIIFSVKYLAPGSSHDMDVIFGYDNGTYPTTDLFNSYYPGDTRKLKTFANSRTVTWLGRAPVTFGLSTTNYGYRRPLKGVSPLPLSTGETTWGKLNKGDYDPIILRWGELMLLKAEAATELGKLAEAKTLVDAIRDRQTTLPHLPATLTQEQMRDSVRHERRVETAYEGALRYYDLKRWKLMETNLHKAFDNDPDFKNLKVTWTAAKYYDLPLPQGEIDKSRGVLVQNPAYTQ